MGKVLPQQEPSGPSYEAARHLVDFLDDVSRRTGYRPHRAKIQEFADGDTAGHSVSLPSPSKGFSEYQLECIQGYAEGLAYWRNVVSELSQLEKTVEIQFRPLFLPRRSSRSAHAIELGEFFFREISSSPNWSVISFPRRALKFESQPRSISSPKTRLSVDTPSKCATPLREGTTWRESTRLTTVFFL